jgi:hypothetical protein
MKRRILLGIVAWLGLSTSLHAQYVVPLDPATARFTFFPGAEGIGVPGGVPNAFELHFGMQGSFSLDELPNNQGDITTADFVLVGNEAAFQGRPGERAFLEETSRQILLTAMFSVERGPPLDRIVFRAEFEGHGQDLVLEFFRQSLVRMDGGPELTAVDGPGYRYTYPVPEPATVLLLLAACACGVMRWYIRRARSTPLLELPRRIMGSSAERSPAAEAPRVSVPRRLRALLTTKAASPSPDFLAHTSSFHPG